MLRLFALPVILQIFCIVHVIWKERAFGWIWLIAFVPVIGSIVYLTAEVIVPFLTKPRDGEAAKSTLGSMKTGKQLRQLEAQAEHSNTFENRIKLADAYRDAGEFEKAIEIYKDSLDGMYADNNEVKAKLANALSQNGNYDEAHSIFEELITNKYRKNEVWLGYIQVLDNLGEKEAAISEFDKYIHSFSNAESRCRYALYLKQNDKLSEARDQFARVVEDAKRLPKYNKREQQQWIRTATKELKECDRLLNEPKASAE